MLRLVTLCLLLGACGGIAEKPSDELETKSTSTHVETIAPVCLSMTYDYFVHNIIACDNGAPLCGFDAKAFATTIDKASSVCYCGKVEVQGESYSRYVCESVVQ